MLKITAKYIALFGTIFCLAVIALGAATRLNDAGLGCPDWPGCYGHFYIPETIEEIEAAETSFKNTPFEADKAIIEMIHRFAASSLGIIAILLVVLCSKLNVSALKTHSVLLLIIIVLQGVFGYLTVEWKLLPIIVTGHLIGGVLVLLLFASLFFRLRHSNTQDANSAKQGIMHVNVYILLLLRVLSVIFFILIFLQIGLGGWVASNYAATACPDFPTCQGEWIPDEANYSEGFTFIQEIGPNYLGGELSSNARTAIHFVHRLGALVIFLISLCYGFLLYITKQKTMMYSLGSLVLLQMVAGISNVLLSFPLALSVMHNLLAVIILCFALVSLLQSFNNYRESEQ